MVQLAENDSPPQKESSRSPAFHQRGEESGAYCNCCVRAILGYVADDFGEIV